MGRLPYERMDKEVLDATPAVCIVFVMGIRVLLIAYC